METQTSAIDRAFLEMRKVFPFPGVRGQQVKQIYRHCIANNERIEAYYARYDEIIEDGLERNPLPQKEPRKRGRVKQSPRKNLVDRLQKHKQEALAFMHDSSAPFGNNLAERDICMMKVKQKVPGIFRTGERADVVCSIRGYICTARNNGRRVLDTIHDALADFPFIPSVGSMELIQG